MKRYYSISQYPGTTGQYYYNYFFKQYNIDAIYTPLGCDSTQFAETITKLLNDSETCGISISMPYKNTVIEYCDSLDDSVIDYNMCNTVVVNDKSIGYNCDLAGVKSVLADIDTHQRITILGNGAIGKMFHTYICDSKYKTVNLYSRSIGNWDDRHTQSDVIINCTALGTISNQSPLEYIPTDVKCVIDLSLKQADLYAQSKHLKYVSGIEFYCYQFMNQFEKYTGIAITKEQFEAARKHR